MRRVWLLVLIAVSVSGLPTNLKGSPATDEKSAASRPEITPEESSDNHWNLELLQQENLQQILNIPSSSSSRSDQTRHQGLPLPVPKEDQKLIVLDLRNFPELARADISSQNPNIQVTIEVVEDTQMEVEMDLVEDGQWNDWSVSSSQWINNHRKLFWPLFWDYPDQVVNMLGGVGSQKLSENYSYNAEDPVVSGVRVDWEQHWNQELDNIESEDWSDWAPCSVTCGPGTQKRTRSCGHACTATESRTCDLDSCPNAKTMVTESTPLKTTETSSSSVDSCEKWLSCRNDFLQKYLQQVLSELPGCPCSYPSEVVYNAVNIPDARLRKTFRWRDASGPKERLDIYKPSARFCIHSMLSYNSTTLAAQHCCYDNQMRLITRGRGAGAPNLISSEFSPELHYKVDVLPWIFCKGDWSRFHSVRPPNNGLDCPQNPPEPQFQIELKEAKEY